MARYSRSRGYNSVMRSNRYKPILVIVLILVAAFLIFKATGVGGLNESNYELRRNTILRSEVQRAVSSVNSLSRLGASSTSSTLGRVRQYVHGVEVINELNIGMYGTVGSLYPQSTFDSIYVIIEEYEAKLSSGQKINDTLMALSEAVELLNTQTQALLNDSTVPEEEEAS